MNTRVFTYIAIFISLVISAPCFAGSELRREWKLSKVYVAEVETRKSVTIKFDQTRYYLYAGCNRFSGIYEKSDIEGSIKMLHGASTRKICKDRYDSEINPLLQSADRYEIKHNHLILYSNGKKIVKFDK